MIHVCFFRESGKSKVSIRGHAGYAPLGKDIVCAAASMLGSALLETLRQEEKRAGIRGLSVLRDGGRLELEFFPLSVERVDLLLKAFENGFAMLSREYPDYVTLDRRLFSSEQMQQST